MRRLDLVCAVLLLGVAAPASAAEKRRPNVIVIYTDDQGTIDANCFGAKDLITPGIDGLAAQGVKFTQFYAAAPVCSPSRAGVLTGRYPRLAGVPGNVGGPPREDVLDLAEVTEARGLPSKQVTMAEMFAAAGYATAHVGKWHLGSGPGSRPLDQGFDFSFGHMGGCIDNYAHFFYWAGPNGHDLWRNNQRVHRDGRFFPDLMVEEARGFIKGHKDKPFFMYFAMNVPHYPYQGEAKWLKHYQHLAYPRKLYAAFMTTLDARIGDLVKVVDEMGLRKNTIIVFQSDHGHSTEQRAHHGGGSAGPYRGAKFSLFEGGIRVPAVISWPGRLPSGASRGQLSHSCDWLPTLAELCDVPLPKSEIDGRSLMGVIESAKAPSPHDVVHWTIGNSWAVRAGPWKLIGNVRDTTESRKAKPLSKQDKQRFLANLEKNAAETRNFAADHPEVVSRLEGLHRTWMQTAGK
ncbi:MAG: sulfatase-like hydrolase/transferase [Phycisphaerae bacterium]|nr:sulfatase-like hydrolase/transferase [Phycisphaerae bacterium]